MRVLVAGLGSIGQRHVRNLRNLDPEAEVVALRRRNHALPADLRGSWLVEVSDLSEALAHRVDAAFICTPTSLHMDAAVPAAKAGCHLMIEKPISDTLELTGILAQEVERRGLRVLVGYQWRFHPGLAAVKGLLNAEAIGRVLHASAHWGEYLPEWHPWEDYRTAYSARRDLGGGALLTLCHPFDYLRWLLGEVTAVSATAGHLSRLEIDVEDSADVLLEFASGAMGLVHLDYIQRPPVHRLELVGEDGTIALDCSDHVVRLRSHRGERVLLPPRGFERNAMFLEEMRHFLGCLTGVAEPAVPLEDGLAALRIVLAAKRAAREGCRVRISDEH